MAGHDRGRRNSLCDRPLHLIDPKEAERLSRDDTLNAFFDKLRLEALEDLASVEADKTVSILRLQQKVAVIDEIRGGLKSIVMLAATSTRTVA